MVKNLEEAIELRKKLDENGAPYSCQIWREVRWYAQVGNNRFALEPDFTTQVIDEKLWLNEPPNKSGKKDE